MTILYYILAAIAGAVIALAVYILVRKMILNGQKEEIIEKAQLEAEKSGETGLQILRNFGGLNR